VTEVKCLRCQAFSTPGNPTATSWDCACGSSYLLRRCSECGNVSMVGSLQRNGEPWECVWCHAANAGFRSRRTVTRSA
jgi:hypothetical protein